MKLRTSWRSVVRFWDQLFECCEFGLVGRFRRRKPAPRKPMFRRPDLTFDMLERREVPASTVAFFPANYMPGESAGSVTITVIRTSGSDAFNVDYTTNNGSATAGNDFTATNGTLSFGASDNSKTFQVAILQDSLDESSTEQFTVTLSESDPNLTIDNPGGTATVQISDDDPTPTVGLSASAYSVNEAAGTLTVPVVLSAASGQTVTVSYSTTPSTASDGSDYTGVPMIPATYVTFNPGQTSQNIVFSITNDGSNEYDEQFSVQFGAMATNATVGTGFAWITIQDDDSSWTPSTEPIGTSEPNFTFGSSGQYDAMSGAAYTSIVLDTGGGIGGGIEGGISGGGECGCGDTLGLLGGGLGGIGGGFELPPPPMGGSSAIVEYFPTILAYNTDAFDVKPIISGTIASAGGAGVPTSIDVRLTWNGSVGSWQNLSTSGLSAGDDYAIAAQVSTAVTSTGYYPFILELRANFSGGNTVTRQLTGNYPVVVPANDNGRGWTVSGVDRIVTVTGGVLYVYGSGGARFFADAGGGNYTSPAIDRGTLVKNGDNTYTYTAIDQNKWNFGTDGRLSNILDTHSLRTTFTYNGSGQIEKITRPSGFATTFSYNTGVLETVIQPGGARITLTRSSDNLTNLAFPDGSRQTFTYDVTSNRMTSDRYGSTTHTFTYNATTGKIATAQLGSNNAWDITPQAANALSTLTAKTVSDYVATAENGANATTTYTLDGGGRPTTMLTPDGVRVTFVYNAAGQPTTSVDGLGKYITSVYSSGDRVSITDQLNKTTTFTYDSTFHQVTSIENPLNQRTTFTFDATTGDPLTKKDPLGSLTTYTWSNGLLQTIKNPIGNVVTFAYNAQRQVESVLTPTGERTTFLYDSAGRRETVINPDGTRTTTVYDAMGRVTGTISPDGTRVTTLYNAAGLPETQIDVNNKRTTYVYDDAGRRTATVDMLGNRLTTVYDADGRVTAQVDMLGQRTTFIYDAKGRQTETVDMYGNRSTTVYDHADRVSATVDQFGQRITFTYDDAGRRTGTLDNFGNRTTSVFDAAGRMTESIDQFGQRTTYVFDSAGRQEAVVDPFGNRTTTVYTNAGQVSEQIDMFGQRTTSIYDVSGRQIATVDPFGNRTSTVFDASGRVEATVDMLGNRTTTVFDSYGRSEATIDIYGKRSTTVYDVLGRVEATVDVFGNRTTTVFDTYGRSEAVVNSLGRTTTVYDNRGRVEATIDALANRTTTVYDATYNRVSATIDARNNRTTFLYDNRGRQEATQDALSNRTTTVYDATYGRVSATINALGKRTTTLYDTRGRVEATQDPLGNRVTTVFDTTYGRVSATIDARNNRTTFLYDSRGRQEAVQNALGERVTTVFDATYGRVSAMIDARNNRTTFLYDARGRQEAVQDALGNRVTTVFDATYGRVSATINQLGNRTTTLYDAFGRQEAIQDPLGNRVTTVYDQVGRVQATVDPLDHRTTFAYDALSRQTTVIDALNGRTTSVYDAVGNVVNIIDPVGNKTTFVFDAVNRKTQQTDPLGDSVTFAYNAAGYMTSTTDRIGRFRDFSYDDAGRQTGEQWYSWPMAIEENRITFTYDANGNQLTARDLDGAYTLTYDALNRVSTSVDMWGKTLTMTYDANGNRTQVQDSASETTNSRFDAANRLIYRDYTTGAAVQLSVTQVYDAAGRVTEQWRYGPSEALVARTSFTYDAANRLTNQQHRDGSGTNIANYTYTYDNQSRLTTEVRNGTTVTYTYDNTDQLTADGSVTVTYDANGNRNNGSYTVTTGNRYSTDGTWTYTYDDEGNLKKKSQGANALTWNYGYDQKNQLVQVQRSQTDGGAVDRQMDFKYDPHGNRIEQSWDADGAGGGGATVTRFAYDGWKNTNQHLVGNENWDVWADLDGGSSLTTRYLRGDVIDQIFARRDSGTTYWTVGDRLGSVRDVVNNAGTVKDTIGYNGFGGITSETDSNFRGRYAWTGREINTEIELQYNRARYYDAGTGRWISQDPLGFDAGDNNLYRYVKNRTTIEIDPSGFDGETYFDYLGIKVALDESENTLVPIPGLDLTALFNGGAHTLEKTPAGKPLSYPAVAFGVLTKNCDPKDIKFVQMAKVFVDWWTKDGKSGTDTTLQVKDSDGNYRHSDGKYFIDSAPFTEFYPEIRAIDAKMDDMKARLVFDSPNMVVAFYDRAEKVHKGAHIEVRMRFETFTIYKKQIVALTQWRAIATTETVDTGLMWWHEYVGIHTWKSGIHSGFVAALKQRLIDTGGDDVLDMKNPVFDGG